MNNQNNKFSFEYGSAYSEKHNFDISYKNHEAEMKKEMKLSPESEYILKRGQDIQQLRNRKIRSSEALNAAND